MLNSKVNVLRNYGLTVRFAVDMKPGKYKRRSKITSKLKKNEKKKKCVKFNLIESS